MNGNGQAGVGNTTDLALNASKAFPSVLPDSDFTVAVTKATIPVEYLCWGCGSSVVKQEESDNTVPVKTIWNICPGCLKSIGSKDDGIS